MPLYTYKCSNPECKVIAEKICSIENRDIVSPCPMCKSEFVRQIDRPGMVYAPTSSGTANHR